jgi:hypothetical protein
MSICHGSFVEGVSGGRGDLSENLIFDINSSE